MRTFARRLYARQLGMAAVLLAGCGVNQGAPLNPTSAPMVRGNASRFGTVYAIIPAGSERVLYTFRGSSDGADPQAGLIDVNGTFYGTTSRGGTSGWAPFSRSRHPAPKPCFTASTAILTMAKSRSRRFSTTLPATPTSGLIRAAVHHPRASLA